MASLKHSSSAPTLPPVVTTMGATKPEIQMHWRHEKLTHKIEQRKAEREAARIKAAALKVLTDEKERFIAEERRKARQKNMWRVKQEVRGQQSHFSRIVQASNKQFETQSMLHDMKTTLRHSTNAVSEKLRATDRLVDSLTRLQDHNRRESKYHDTEARIKDIMSRVFPTNILHSSFATPLSMISAASFALVIAIARNPGPSILLLCKSCSSVY